MSVVGIFLVAVAGIVATVVSGNEPLLGIDLQGGVSVVLEPDTETTDQQLDDAIEIIRSRVDSFGVAEPDIVRDGETVEVALPGTTEDQRRAIELVEQTGELQFRPLLTLGPVPGAEPGASTIPPGATATSVPPDGSSTSVPSDTTATSAPPEGTATTAAPTTTIAPAAAGQVPTTTAAPGDDPAAPGPTVPAQVPTTTAAPGDDPAAPGPTVPAQGEGPAVPEPDPTATLGSQARCLAEFESRAEDQDIISESGVAPTDPDTGATPVDDQLLCDIIVVVDELPEQGPVLKTLGPTAFTGVKLSGADANFRQVEWVIDVSFNGGGDPGDGTLPSGGASLFDEMATVCATQSPECPTNQLAFVLDGEVLSDPQFQETSFEGSAQISGGFTEEEAKNDAIALRYGALPVAFENQGVRTVSASIGEDALRSGVVAGLIGLAFVSVFILAYYRWFGLVALISLALSAAMLWTIIAWLGSSRGLALTLAGITGIIVSIGVTVDSNIVYFEHLREDVRNGRTPRSAVDRAFPLAYSTIVKADAASLIGAGLLYWLTTGAVRGFALYLGVATVLDLVATYFFVGPAVRLIGRRKGFGEHPERYGVPTPAEATP